MENPRSWDRLTASLAASHLDAPGGAWEFLVWQGLVRNEPGDAEVFQKVVRKEMARGPITGPTIALRVANALKAAGIATPSGEAPDPWGKIAEEKRQSFSSSERR